MMKSIDITDDLTDREANWLLKLALLTQQMITISEAERRCAEVTEHVCLEFMKLKAAAKKAEESLDCSDETSYCSSCGCGKKETFFEKLDSVDEIIKEGESK